MIFLIGGDRRTAFAAYLQNGGLPYVTQLQDSVIHREYLEGIFNTVLLKDVVQRKGISDVTLLRSVIRFLFDNIEIIVSVKKIADSLTPYGSSATSVTVGGYVEALMEAFILYKAKRYDVRGKQLLKSLEKYYLVDLGFLQVLFGESRSGLSFALEESTKDFHFYTWAHYTKVSYYHLFIPKYFGENFGKFIHLDVDLVVNCDIGELLSEANGPHAVWGTLNYSTPSDAEYIRSLGLSYLNYINAGIMVIDCERLNRLGYFEKAAAIIAEQRQFTYIDQDVLNLACSGDIGRVDPSWNLQWNNINYPELFVPEVRSAVTQITEPRIVHFTIDKPWKRMLNRFGEYYTKYAAQNPVYKYFDLLSDK